MYILRGAPASRNRATALEEKLSAVACESPWQHERYEAALSALNPGRNRAMDQLKPQTSLGQ